MSALPIVEMVCFVLLALIANIQWTRARNWKRIAQDARVEAAQYKAAHAELNAAMREKFERDARLRKRIFVGIRGLPMIWRSRAEKHAALSDDISEVRAALYRRVADDLDAEILNEAESHGDA